MIVTLEQLMNRQKEERTFFPADIRLIDGQVVKTFRVEEVIENRVLGYKVDDVSVPVGEDRISILEEDINSIYVPYWDLKEV